MIGKNWHLGYLKLMKRAASYAEVERIFVHPAVKKALCENAGTDRAWLGKVRPIFLHNYHFHVRIACPKGAKGCEPQKQAPAGDGCGKPVEDWIKIVSRPLKATPAPTPGKPVKPVRARVLTLANLPAECRAVLASEAPALAGSSAPTAAAIPLPERRRKVLGGL